MPERNVCLDSLDLTFPDQARDWNDMGLILQCQLGAPSLTHAYLQRYQLGPMHSVGVKNMYSTGFSPMGRFIQPIPSSLPLTVANIRRRDTVDVLTL